MGVSVKRTGDEIEEEAESHSAGAILTGMSDEAANQDKSKKRKR